MYASHSADNTRVSRADKNKGISKEKRRVVVGLRGDLMPSERCRFEIQNFVENIREIGQAFDDPIPENHVHTCTHVQASTGCSQRVPRDF